MREKSDNKIGAHNTWQASEAPDTWQAPGYLSKRGNHNT